MDISFWLKVNYISSGCFLSLKEDSCGPLWSFFAMYKLPAALPHKTGGSQAVAAVPGVAMLLKSASVLSNCVATFHASN